jgi:hypothetical protein
MWSQSEESNPCWKIKTSQKCGGLRSRPPIVRSYAMAVGTNHLAFCYFSH